MVFFLLNISIIFIVFFFFFIYISFLGFLRILPYRLFYIEIFWTFLLLFVLSSFYLELYRSVYFFMFYDYMLIFDFSSHYLILVLYVLLFIYFFMFYLDMSYIFFNIEYICISFFSFLGFFFICMCNDLFLFFVCLELGTIPLYVLICSCGRGIALILRTEAALKYFICNALFSGFYMYIISLLYIIGGSLCFSKLYLYSWFVSKDLYILLIFCFFFIVLFLLFKLGLFPFHFWLALVYEGVSYSVLIYVLSIPKVIYLGFFIKVLFIYDFFFFEGFSVLLSVSSLFSVFFGVLGLYKSSSFRLLVAYSSIMNFGFVLYGLSFGSWFMCVVSCIYFVSYLLISILFIFVLVSIERVMCFSIDDLSDIGGISVISARLAGILFIFFYFFSALPPSPLFFGKFFLLVGSFVNGSVEIYFFVLFLLVCSVISMFVYARLSMYLYLDTGRFYFLVSNERLMVCIYIYIFFFLIFGSLQCLAFFTI